MALFDGIETYIAVVEEGSITAAASRLGLSKSFVSETVKALENRLGVRLLDRTTRSLRPTEAGQAFYDRAARAQAEAISAQAEAQRFQEAPVGRLRVAVFEGFHRLGLPACLEPFLDANPSLEIEFVQAIEAVNLVEKGMDLAIRLTPAPDPGLIVRRLGTSRVGLYAAPAYLECAGTPLHPSELVGHRTLAFAPLYFAHEWRFTVGGRPITIPARPSLLANSSEILRSAATAGLGITALPVWNVADLIESGALVQILEEFPVPESALFAVYASNRLMTPKVKLFVDHIVRCLPRAVLQG
jgi:DNA-binding transcriptional LysR family regulator